MNALPLAVIGLFLMHPVSAGPQNPPSLPAEAGAATVRDFLEFARAMRPLRQGQLSSVLVMDLQTEGKALQIRAEFKQTYTATGKYVSEVAFTPPGTRVARHYRVYGDGKSETIYDIDGRTYAIQPAAAEAFFTRGLLAEMGRQSFEKMPPEIEKMLDAKTLAPELEAVLKDKLSGTDAEMRVQSTRRNGKPYRVYLLPSGKESTGPVEIYVNVATGAAELLQLKLKQEKVAVVVQEKVIKASAVVPSRTRFRFVPTRRLKKVDRIEIGG